MLEQDLQRAEELVKLPPNVEGYKELLDLADKNEDRREFGYLIEAYLVRVTDQDLVSELRAVEGE